MFVLQLLSHIPSSSLPQSLGGVVDVNHQNWLLHCYQILGGTPDLWGITLVDSFKGVILFDDIHLYVREVLRKIRICISFYRRIWQTVEAHRRNNLQVLLVRQNSSPLIKTTKTCLPKKLGDTVNLEWFRCSLHQLIFTEYYLCYTLPMCFHFTYDNIKILLPSSSLVL